MTDPSQPIKPTDSNPTRARETVADVAPEANEATSDAKNAVAQNLTEGASAAVMQTHPDTTANSQALTASTPVARFDADAPSFRVAADSRGRTKSEAEFKSLSRRSLLTGAAGALAAFVGWRTLQGRPDSGNIPDVLRTGHEVNESVWRSIFRSGADAPTFDFSESSMMRVNGRHGIQEDLDLDTYELRVLGRDGELLGTHQPEDLRAMKQTEMVVEHKCVEGWSHIVTWGGVVFSDFLERFYPEQADAKFVGLSTPDEDYNVGLEMDAMMHSQTMLTLDLQRAPLTAEHGAPVRLTTPLKYGTKNIKRIGTIQFSDTQPENDYWTVRGYDWYAAL